MPSSCYLMVLGWVGEEIGCRFAEDMVSWHPGHQGEGLGRNSTQKAGKGKDLPGPPGLSASESLLQNLEGSPLAKEKGGVPNPNRKTDQKVDWS